MAVAGIDLSDVGVLGPAAGRSRGGLRAAARRAAAGVLRGARGPLRRARAGYYALVKHADVVEASKHPDVFSSGQGATNILGPAGRVQRVLRVHDQHGRPPARPAAADRVPRVQPADDQEVRGRRARWPPRSSMTCWTGPCDFVANVAARLPLKIICHMMGIPDDQYARCCTDTNIILSGVDPEFLSEDMDQAVMPAARRRAGARRAGHRPGRRARQAPGDDLVSALANANIDGSSSPAPSSPRSSSCWWWRATRPPATRCRTR